VGTLQADQVTAHISRSIFREVEISGGDSCTIYEGTTVGADDGAVIMRVPGDIVVDATTNGANGLDTGSLAASTWYYLFLIWNPATETIAGLWSASSTNPVMPSGYTAKRLISATYSPSGSLRTITQHDRQVATGTTILAGSGNTNGTYPIDLSTVIPPVGGVRFVAFQSSVLGHVDVFVSTVRYKTVTTLDGRYLVHVRRDVGSPYNLTHAWKALGAVWLAIERGRSITLVVSGNTDGASTYDVGVHGYMFDDI
jgi:hypothetical protein